MAVILALLALLLGTAAMLLPLGVRWFVCKDMTPDEKRELTDWLQRPRKIPQEWREAKPFSAELLSACDSQYQYYMTRRASLSQFDFNTTTLETARGSSVPLSREFLSSVTDFLTTAQPCLERMERLAQRPDYTAELFCPPPGMPRQNEGYFQLRDICRQLNLRSEYYLLNGDYDMALSDSLTMFTLGKHHAATSLVCHAVSCAMQGLAMEPMEVIARESTDTALLRRALGELNQLEPFFENSLTSDAMFTDSIGQLRRMAREGYPVDFSPEKPCLYWTMQMMEGYRKFPLWKLSTLPAGDPHREALIQYLEMNARRPATSSMDITFMWNKKWCRMLCTVAPEILYSQLKFSSYLSTNVALRKAEYDLTRLLIAGRLIDKEGKSTSSTLANYTPAYLPQMPTDPFTGKPYLWSRDIGGFYSIGPDHADNKCKLAYEKYSSSSPGDIWIP